VVIERKLSLLGAEAQYDLSCACGGSAPRKPGLDGRWIYPAMLPNGQTIHMLKVLLDNSCTNDCRYCAQRAGSNIRRERFNPDELAKIFVDMHNAQKVAALFLSSGLGSNPVRTMDRMLATAEILRHRYRYRGFIHLKILPGAELAQIERAAKLAQRLSINLEAPGPERLRRLSGHKNFSDDMLTRLRWIARLVQTRAGIVKGHTTQFVVGAAGESDREIVSVTHSLYRELSLSRVYYSAFQPIAGTPLGDATPTPRMREHRLYQADFLLRRYGFSSHEIPFSKDGAISLHEDPKTTWAKAHPDFFPLEINRAEKEKLLRVPGLGPIAVSRIIAERASSHIREPEDLRRLSKTADLALPYLLLNGRRPSVQLAFW
jgi:predicted DNA-binding helix-hairpin-helix protein